jgi:hypothetical protein
MAPLPYAADVANGLVLVAITVVVLPVAAIAFARSGPAWRRIGKGPLALAEPPTARRERRSGAAARFTQEAELRQMLEAKSYRRMRRGEPALDVEAELRRLLEEPAGEEVDDELRTEVRQLVVRRNERRLSRGEEPLDVEAETDRQLADLIRSS